MEYALRKHNKTDSTMKGWIKLHRCLCDWEHYQEPSVIMVFIDLLLHANTKDGFYRGCPVKPGESARSLRTISQSVGLAVNTVRVALDKLTKSGEIKRRKFKFGIITTINNFDSYQGTVSTIDTPIDTPVDTPIDTPVDTKQEYKNIRNNIDVVDTHARAHTHEGLIVGILEQTSSLNTFCMQNRVSVEDFTALAHEVVNDWSLQGTTHTDEIDARRHLFNTIRIKLKERKRNGNNRSTYKEQRDKLYAGTAATIARLAAEDDARAAKVRNS